MNNLSLKKTKKKLTIIFTILVIGILILIELIFFTGKYYNYNINETKIFNNLSNNISNNFITLDSFLKNHLKQGNKKKGLGKMNNKIINLIIIDKLNNEIVFSNVFNQISNESIEKILKYKSYNKNIQIDGFLVKKDILIDKNKNKYYDFIFIKDLKYSIKDYFKDLFSFIFITLLFSIVFYYIGYKFVSKNLKPVEENITDMNNFIHNAGHELKTPISIIYGNLQLIKEIKNFDEELINEGLLEINKLNNLIESLITLSSINNIVNKESINIFNEIKGIVKNYEKISSKKNIKININKIDDIDIKINKEYFYILFSNILSNAIKYNIEGGKIDILIKKNELIIKDTGIGINKKDINKVFDRFFKSFNGRDNEGYGIGLSLVNKIVNLYKWKIFLKSKIGKGTEVIIKF